MCFLSVCSSPEKTLNPRNDCAPKSVHPVVYLCTLKSESIGAQMTAHGTGLELNQTNNNHIQTGNDEVDVESYCSSDRGHGKPDDQNRRDQISR